MSSKCLFIWRFCGSATVLNAWAHFTMAVRLALIVGLFFSQIYILVFMEMLGKCSAWKPQLQIKSFYCFPNFKLFFLCFNRDRKERIKKLFFKRLQMSEYFRVWGTFVFSIVRLSVYNVSLIQVTNWFNTIFALDFLKMKWKGYTLWQQQFGAAAMHIVFSLFKILIFKKNIDVLLPIFYHYLNYIVKKGKFRTSLKVFTSVGAASKISLLLLQAP